MKKFARILSVIMVVALMATLFASCKKEDNVLKMGTNAAFPPYEYYEGDVIVGIDAEVGALIAEKLDMDFEIMDMDFNGIISAVQNGVVDIGMAGMTVKPDRLEHVNFSTTYAKGVQVVIVKEGSDIATLDDLNGKKIYTAKITHSYQRVNKPEGTKHYFNLSKRKKKNEPLKLKAGKNTFKIVYTADFKPEAAALITNSDEIMQASWVR